MVDVVREALEVLFFEKCETGLKLNLLNKHGAVKQSKISAAAVLKSHVAQISHTKQLKEEINRIYTVQYIQFSTQSSHALHLYFT